MSDSLSMSDEEFESMPMPADEEVNDNLGEGAKTDTTKVEDAVDTNNATEGNESLGNKEGETPTGEVDDKPVTDDIAKDQGDAEKVDDVKEGEHKEEGEKDNKAKVDFEAEYNKLMEPFKANGSMMQVESTEDIIRLMQMGANYSHKMTSLKPNMKILKKLKNNNLLDEAKLNYLIDLDKKNPDAINKLIKDSEINPLEIDLETDNGYQPNTYNVNDAEVEIDGILDEIQETESYERTADILSNKWDAKSRAVISSSPEIIRVINDQVASGIYDQINSVVTRDRALGKLNGLSDIEAYKVVGDTLQAAGSFANLDNSNGKTSLQDKLKKPTAKKKDDPNLKNRKKAAASTKSAPAKKQPKYDPLSMSDEEIAKLDINSLNI